MENKYIKGIIVISFFGGTKTATKLAQTDHRSKILVVWTFFLKNAYHKDYFFL